MWMVCALSYTQLYAAICSRQSAEGSRQDAVCGFALWFELGPKVLLL